jgi:hypothetical protein
VSIGHFTNARPKRLFRDPAQASWALEVERLVPLDDRVLRPMTQTLVGNDVVLFQLANCEEGRPLVGDARRLMSEPAGDDASYEVDDGRWIPAAFLTQITQRAAGTARGRGMDEAPVKAPGVVASSLELTLLREEMRELRAAYEKLQRRVAHLERSGVVGGTPAHEVEHEVRSAPPRAAPAAGGRAARAARAEKPAPATPAPPPPTKPVGGMALPTADALGAQLSAVIGQKSKLLLTKKPLDLSSKELWGTPMLDDSDVEVGSMICNLEAVVTQGALLMLLPESEIAEQIKNRQPSEEVASAMAEILNVATAAFNNIADNPHIRAGTFGPFSRDERLKTLGPRIDLADGNGAQIAFVLRGEEG